MHVPSSVADIKTNVTDDDTAMAVGGSSVGGSSVSIVSLPTITVSEGAPSHPCKLKVGVVAPYFFEVSFDLPLSAELIRLLTARDAGATTVGTARK